MISLRSSPMKHMSLFLLKDDVPDAAVILAQSQAFDISKANVPDKKLVEHYEEDYAKEFDQSLERYKKIISFLNINLTDKVKEVSQISYQKLKHSNEQLGEIWNQCLLFEIRQRKLHEQKNMIGYLKAIWKNMAIFNTDLSMIDQSLQFLDIRIGTMPSGYVTRLKKSLSLEGYHLDKYMFAGESTHVVIAGLKENQEKIKSLLDAAGFQRIQIPEELQGQPEKVSSKIQQLEHQYHAEYLHYKQNLTIFRDRYINQILVVGDILALAKPYRLLSQEMRGVGALIKVSGWVLKSEIDSIKHQLNKSLGKKAVIIIREPEPDEFSSIPSDVKHSKWVRPFMNLIKHYGIPRYNEFDPSWFFTLSYILMFGIMFGDVGHGLSLMLLALVFYRKWPDIAFFLLPVGISSVVFGFLYGSIFCYEHIIPAIWVAPLSDPVLMLKVAFLWGVSFIIMLNIFSIYNRVAAKNIRHVILDSQGVVGLLLYIAMLWIGYLFAIDSFNKSYLLFVLIPLIFISVNKWFSYHECHGERLIIVLIEGYELMINYLANTISFLRLAAFSLNHVALAITVFTLADMMEGTGYWVTIVLGNLFILILEGAVVAIQTLRLEYYEGFSRFFYADGYQFKPLTISPKKLL